MECAQDLVHFATFLWPLEKRWNSLGLMIRKKGQNKYIEHFILMIYEGKCKRKCPNRNLFLVVNPREFPGTNWYPTLAR